MSDLSTVASRAPVGETAPFACPVCGGTFYTVRVMTPLLTVLRCGDCGLHRQPPRVATRAAPAGDYYQDQDLETYLAYYGPLRRRVFRENWRRIAGWRPAGAALDIGASFGWFAAVAPPGWRVIGLEPAAAVAARAQQMGLDVRVGGIVQASLLTQRFDLVTLWNVLEHLPDPRWALEQLRARLVPGGLLALCIPSRYGLFNRLAYAAYDLSAGRIQAPLHTLFQVRNPAPHLYHYAPRDLFRLLKEGGFQVLAAHGQPIIDWRRLHLRARLEGAGGRQGGRLAGRALMALLYYASHVLRWPDEVAIYAQRCGGSD